MNDSRARAQLVVSLGEGTKGDHVRALLDKAAGKAGKPVTTWAREVLIVAAVDLLGEDLS